MRTLILVLACLACAGHAEVSRPLKSLAEALRNGNVATAFNPSSSAAGSATHATSSGLSTRPSDVRMDAMEDLKATAKDLNPLVGFWDPLGLSTGEFWGDTNEATIGFLREAEIKHGRIAMAGFVGYIVHANDIRFPWKPFADVPKGVSPQALWDGLPAIAKWQIFTTIAFFEFWRENSYVLAQDGQKHYMRGGTPGYFPTFDQLPHPVPFNLYDPFGLSRKMPEEKRQRRLLMEINNGRLAMIGLMGFLAESQVPGSVPALSSLGIRPYAGNIMAPFEADFKIL